MTRAKRIPKLGIGDGVLAITTLGLLGEGITLYPERVESGSQVYVPTLTGPEPEVVAGGASRERRRPWVIYPRRVESNSLVFWPLVVQNPPRSRREREEEDAIALMF